MIVDAAGSLAGTTFWQHSTGPDLHVKVRSGVGEGTGLLVREAEGPATDTRADPLNESNNMKKEYCKTCAKIMFRRLFTYEFSLGCGGALALLGGEVMEKRRERKSERGEIMERARRSGP